MGWAWSPTHLWWNSYLWKWWNRCPPCCRGSESVSNSKWGQASSQGAWESDSYRASLCGSLLWPGQLEAHSRETWTSSLLHGGMHCTSRTASSQPAAPQAHGEHCQNVPEEKMSACILCEYMTADMVLKTKTTQHPLVESVNEMGPNHSEQLGF